MVEYDPLYCDRIVQRFEALTGKRARLAATGETFEDRAEKRAAAARAEGFQAGGGPMSGESAKRKPAGGYEVGYGKPPVHSRFQKGRSGNPRGRPRREREGVTICCTERHIAS